MKLSTMGRLTAEGAGNIFKGGWMSLASIVTVSISLLVLALVALGALNMQFIMDTVQEEMQVMAWLPDDFNETEGRHVAAIIARYDAVRDAEFISKEENLERLRAMFGDDAQYYLDGVDEANPLPHAVEIWAHDATAIPALVARIEAETPVAEVIYQPEIVDRINRLATALQVAGVGLVAMMLLATIFVIANTIRLTVHSRRDEIKVMSLVGATDGFIRTPFLMEGVLLGLLGALLAGSGVWAGYVWIAEQVGRNLPFLPMLHPDMVVVQLVQLLIAVGAVVGFVGSGLSLRRYLQAKGG